MLMIVVSRRKQPVYTADGSRGRVRMAFIRKNKKLKILQEQEDYQGVTSVRFVSKTWWRVKRLSRHEGLEWAVAEVLRRHHAKSHEWFDCYSFACLVHRVPENKKQLSKKWVVVDRKAPKVGDVIFFLDKRGDRFRHAAVYLADGIYVSVWGAGGDLEFGTLEDMRKTYKDDVIVSVTTRAQAAIA